MDKRSTASKITNQNHYGAAADSRCMARVQSALGDMVSTPLAGNKYGNRRHTGAVPSSGYMDLSGYALHQRLRTAPGAEMYVTGMRARIMPPRDDVVTAESSYSGGGVRHPTGSGDRSWAHVDGCRYDPMGNTLEARMRFGRSLMVSGSVRLLYGSGSGGISSPVETGCDMTLRLRPRAGLGFTAVPLTMPEKSPPNRLTATPTMTIRTTATFIDPEPMDDPTGDYVSVHSYNCVGGAAGFPGIRERPATAAVPASSDHFEQFLSAEDENFGGGNSDEILTSGIDAGGVFDIDLNDDSLESTEFGDKRSTSRRPSSSSTVATTTVDTTVTPVTNRFGSAGFVTPAAFSPEPRLRRIQYQKKPSLQHPMLTVVSANNHHQQTQDQLLMEMEEVFVRGVRSLLAKHMERTLKPALKDSLMANMGYTVSYG